MNKITIIVLISLLLIHFSCHNDISSPLENIQLSDHILEGYYITAIDFDSEGTAWIGTFRQGLIKYDGNITCFDTNNTSLPDSLYIRDIAVDKNDRVWIGTNKGLVKYCNDEFIFFTKSNSIMVTDNVYAISIDSEDNIWFTSCMFQSGGLIRFDGNDQWKLYTPQNSNLPGSLIGDILCDNQSNIWISIQSGSIVKIYNEEITIFSEEDIGIELYYFGNLASDLNGTIYSSIDYSLSSLADDSRPNIISFNGNNWEVENPVDENNISLGYVNRIGVDLNGNLWAQTSKSGIAIYDGNNWIYNEDNLNIENIVNDISIDSDNNVWFGCGNGIYIINNP